MGLLDKLFPGRTKDQQIAGYFKTLTAYAPVFYSRDGGLYEAELTRSAIHAFANMASKLKPEVSGSARTSLARQLQYQPNPWMDTTKFLYRTATILEAATTCFVVPLLDPTGTSVQGFYPILPQRCELVTVKGAPNNPWLRYEFANGQYAAIEFSRVGMLTKFQYKDDFFGSGNDALSPTLDLLDIQRQGMTNAVKLSAAIRFFGRLGQTLRPEDVEAERQRFSADNLSLGNDAGVVLVDAKYADIQQMKAEPWLIDAAQMDQIRENVFNYFGVNSKILQNDYDENQWNAYYEGKVEPFALQLSLVLTNMVFSERERSTGNAIMFSSNRLQYASNSTKLQVTRELVDRGIISNFAAADIWNLPYPPGEERWVIRGEYIDIDNLPNHTVDQAKSYLQPAPAEPADPEE